MKALFVGLGSVGQRHLNNFGRLAGRNAVLLAYRKKKKNILIEKGLGKKVGSLKKSLGFNEINDLDEALRAHPDIVFVTNPTSMHMETALRAVKFGVRNIFIEKPLSDDMRGVVALKRAEKRNGLTIMIGYQGRFHPCYALVKDILSTRKYGNILSASFEWGTYLPSHHPYEDYRNGYAAQKKLGGGVILGLIHEIDMIRSFFGQPEKVFAIGGKLSNLEMDSDDTVSVLMGFRDRTTLFPVSLFLSYAQTKETRAFRIQLDNGTILCDFMKSTLEIFDKTGSKVVNKSYRGLKRNDLFLSEMKEFLCAVNKKRRPSVTLDDGIESLRLALKIMRNVFNSHARRLTGKAG